MGGAGAAAAMDAAADGARSGVRGAAAARSPACISCGALGLRTARFRGQSEGGTRRPGIAGRVGVDRALGDLGQPQSAAARSALPAAGAGVADVGTRDLATTALDRKSTRLNSSH